LNICIQNDHRRSSFDVMLFLGQAVLAELQNTALPRAQRDMVATTAILPELQDFFRKTTIPIEKNDTSVSWTGENDFILPRMIR
jgi:hypothetical protein